MACQDKDEADEMGDDEQAEHDCALVTYLLC